MTNRFDEPGGAPKVVKASPMPPFLSGPLEEQFGAVELDAATDLSQVEAAVVAFGHGVTAEMMDRLPALKVIANFGVGYDANDVAEADRRGISIVNTPEVLNDAVADVAVGLVIDVMRQLSAADRFVRRGDWATGQKYPLTRQVARSRMGILGLGRIGLAIARRLEAFDAEISYHSRSRRDDVSYRYAESPVALAAGCDVMIVVTPGGPETEGLVSAEVLDALGPDGFLVNVARGSVVDQVALVSALVEGRLAGAGLDVYADEPAVPEELVELDNVVLLPHLASGSVETRHAMALLILDNVAAHLRGRDLITPV